MFGTFDEVFAVGVRLYQAGNVQRSADYFAHAIEIQPDAITAYVNLGMVLRRLNQLDASLGVLLRGLDVAPRSPECHMDLALTYGDLDRFPESLRHLTLANALSDAYLPRYNMAALYARMGHYQDSLFWYDKTLEVAPEDHEARFFKACALLALGRFEDGWAGYELRRSKTSDTVPLSGPEWRGERSCQQSHEHILVHAEQGFGDTIQSARYIALVASRFGKVSVVPGGELVRLFQHSFAHLTNVAVMIDVPEAYDCHVWIDSLMGIFGAGLDDLSNAPYLCAPSTTEWSTRLAVLDGIRIGIVWSGGHSEYRANKYRSLRFEQIAGLLDVPGCSFVSLQMGAHAGVSTGIFDASPYIDDWQDTAAAIAALDLVISVDTSTAHLAGAMGTPVWLLNQFQSCWRWGLTEPSTRWYPSMRIIRQPCLFDWPSVLAEARDGLLALTAPLHSSLA